MVNYLIGSYIAIILTIIIVLLATIGMRIVYGIVAKRIAIKRGMKGEGFWWGFCLGIIGIIVMRCCPKY